MKKLVWAKKTAAIIMLAAIITTGMPPVEAEAQHGTTTEIITKDMVNNTPPKDYVINEDMQAEAKDGLYSEYFLKDRIQTVSITIEENNLNYLLQNALDEPNVMTQSVVIGGKEIGYAGIKTKGNYTLQATNASDSDRFSFTINFGKYITKKKYGAKQNFYGLGKVSFNNLYFDKTAMKEYCAMRLMDEMGLPTPEYGIAKLYINGEYYGVYFMVEAMDSSIVERYLNTDEISDYLTKPMETRFIYDNALDKYKDENGSFTMESLGSVLYENEDGEYVAEGELSGSSGLWENDNDTLQDVAESLPTVLTWEEKLTLLSEGKDFSGNSIDVNSKRYIKLLNEIMDVDEALRYFATHSFIVQPRDMIIGLSNLKKLISMRSVGVWLQTNDMDTIVTGAGADLTTIGNGMTGKYTVSGTLTVVNADTGIFATSAYPEEGSCGPELKINVLDKQSTEFKTIKEKLGCANDGDLIVYQMSNTKTPDSLYQLYIPVSEEFETKDTSIYSYSDDELTKLKVKKDDNLYKVKTDDISYIVVAKNCQASKKNINMQTGKEANAKIKTVLGKSYIVGAEDMSTLWWSAHSKHYELPDNSVTTVEFENYSGEAHVWDNYVMVFTNEAATYGLERSLSYEEYAVVRADDFGWGTQGHTLSYTHTYESFEEFQDILKSASIKMTITRNGSDITVHEIVTSLEDTEKAYERTVTFTASTDRVYLTMTVEGGYLKINNVYCLCE